MENRATEHIILPIKPAIQSQKVNDIAFRVFLIPFFGIAIPIITKLNKQISLANWFYLTSYAYTILIAFIVWQGNRYLLLSLRAYFDWFKKPVRKIIILLFAICFYTIPVSLILLVGWFFIFASGIVDWNIIFTSVLIIMICVIFITHVYETVFLVKESENEILKNEQLEKAKSQSELEALKNQIDPHFIFNCLNTLSHLIEDNPAAAKQFNDNMAEVYRYILHNKAKELVLLREEISFLKDYFSLVKIRFGNAVQLHLNVPVDQFDQFLIPPISLQMLMENAIKHNEFSNEMPLVINIVLFRNVLITSNKMRKKILLKPSSRTGLSNLNQRCQLLTEKPIVVNEESDFSVAIPVLGIS